MIKFYGDNGRSWRITEQGMYPDGTPMVKVGEEIYNDIVTNAHTIEIRTTHILEFFTGLAFVDGISIGGGEIKTLVLPFIPGARQDRVNPSGDVLATLNMVAGMINFGLFDHVAVADPHSPVATTYIYNLAPYPLANIYKRLWQGYAAVIAPDKGGVPRATMAAETLGVPLVLASKTRDVSTGRLTGFEVEVESGKHYVVIDDLCDGGGTFVGLGEKIVEQGAFADLYVTHGLFTKGFGELKKYYKNIYTTDSVIPRDPYPKDVYTINIVDDMVNTYV